MRACPLRFALVGFLAAITLTAAALAATPAASPAGAPRTLTIDDYFALRDVEDPRLSPDGAWVAYTVASGDPETDEVDSRIWMVPTAPTAPPADTAAEAGDGALAMTAEGGSASSPRWSPDNRYLTFLEARGDDEAQVWALDRRGGEATALTAVPQGVSAYEWSPDGRRLALVIQDPKPKPAGEKEDKKCDCDKDEDEEEATPPPWVIDRLQFKVDKIGYLDRRRDHLYLLDVGTAPPATPAEPVQITFGDYDDSEPVWSPDGRWIAFVSNRSAEPDLNYNSDLWAVTTAAPATAPADIGGDGKATERPLVRLTDHPGLDDHPTWSPDGRWIAYLATPDGARIFDYASRAVAVVPAPRTGEPSAGRPAAPRLLATGLDRVFYAARFAADSAAVLTLLEDRGEQQLTRVPLDDGPVERLVGGRDVVADLDPVAGGDGAVALLVSTPHRPPEVHLWSASGGLRRLTHTNDRALAGVDLGEVESFQATSADGTPVQSFLVKPPGFTAGRRVPAVLWIHGGPQSQYDWRFDFEPQILAANGYLVVLPNPRGSTGWGQDFALGIWQSWGEKDFDDVMAAVDWTIARGLADPDRLGVGGWSYGGILTDHVITKTQRFKAAISGASEVLYVANYGTDQYQRWWEQELGLPWEPEARKIYERMSPFNHLDRVTTPTLVLCGEQDWNVPVLNSEQLYQALRRLGKADTLLVVYPGQSHTLAVPSYEKDRFERYLGWFGKYLKVKEGDRPPG